MVRAGMGFQQTGPLRASPQSCTALGLLPEDTVLFLPVGHIKRTGAKRRFPCGRNRGPLTWRQRQRASIRLRPGQEKADGVGRPLRKAAQVDPAPVHLMAVLAVGEGNLDAVVGAREIA